MAVASATQDFLVKTAAITPMAQWSPRSPCPILLHRLRSLPHSQLKTLHLVLSYTYKQLLRQYQPLLLQLQTRHARSESTACTDTVRMVSAFVRLGNMLDRSAILSGVRISAQAMECASRMASASVQRDGWDTAARSLSARMHAMAMVAA